MSRTGQRKEEIITFKVDEKLAEALGKNPKQIRFHTAGGPRRIRQHLSRL